MLMMDPPPRAIMSRCHGLDREELVAQVGVQPFVPIVGRHIGPGMAVVAGGVIHQHIRRADPRFQRGEGGPQAGDVAQVAKLVRDVLVRCAEGRAALGVEVNEADLGALRGEAATISAPIPEAPPVT